MLSVAWSAMTSLPFHAIPHSSYRSFSVVPLSVSLSPLFSATIVAVSTTVDQSAHVYDGGVIIIQPC